MPRYAVTGVTGHFGRHVVEELLSRGVPADDVVAVVRTPGKATELVERGVQVREGDYSRPETLPAALVDVQRLLLVSGTEVGQRVAQHTAVIEAAKANGAERIAYTSVLRADTTTNPVAGDHRGTEEALRTSGVPFTVLRNCWYTEVYTAQLSQYLERGEILGAAGTGKVSAAPRADYAAAAATALLDDAAGDVVYELGGPGFSMEELATTVSQVSGTKVVYRDLPSDDYAVALEAAGFDAGAAAFVAAIDTAIASGDLETDSDDLPRLLGRPVTPLADAIRNAMAA